MTRFDPNDASWMARGNCLGVDPDLFFPERGAIPFAAKKVCASCAVREQCLEWAIVHIEKYGVWGGKTERERRRIRGARRRGEAA